MKKSLLTAIMALGILTFFSCCDGETYETSIIKDGSISIGNGTISYRVATTALSVGESLKIDLAQNSEENIAAVLYWDGAEIATIKDFPYTYEKKMETKGTHKLSIKTGMISENGSISVSVSASIGINIEVK